MRSESMCSALAFATLISVAPCQEISAIDPAQPGPHVTRRAQWHVRTPEPPHSRHHSQLQNLSEPPELQTSDHRGEV